MKNQFIPGAIAGAIAGLLISLAVQNTTPQQSSQPTNTTQESAYESTNAYEQAVISVVKNAEPAVVSIVITKDVPKIEQYFENLPNSFGPFGFQIPRLRQNGTEEREIGGGSGFLVSADGTIVTNRHVVSDTEATYTVFLNDGTKFEAEVIARDPVNDIAILHIDGNNLPYLSFGDSDTLQVGQSAVAIGNALGEFQNTVSTGIVSGLSRSIQAGDGFGQTEQLEEVIQTDAAINPGNSGGPLLDLAGNVIGVNVAVALGSQNVGFALPANAVKTIIETVERDGKISTPYIGVRYVPVTPSLKEANNLTVDYGALVVRGEDADELAVVPGSPANKAGIVEGDIILEIDGTKIDENASLASVIRKKSVGDTISLKISSKGEEKTVQVTLEEFTE